jgi:CYTH domain-containing protein
MRMEFERKFLVSNDSWKTEAGEGLLCRQGYLVSDPEKTVRIRIIGKKGFLTIKGATQGIGRPEFEYEIPADDAEALLKRCGSLIEKTRYFIPYVGMVWELDVFAGENEGLVLVEIELPEASCQFELPSWIGKEVSEDARYYNACLAQHPFSAW